MSRIAANLVELEKRISRACDSAGRPRENVRLIAVSKTMPAIAVAEAIHHGVTDIGENRVQEAAGKFDGFRGGVRHLIGPLQSNKVRKAVELFDWIQTIDSEKLGERIDRIAGELEKRPDVLIQVNVGGEAAKSGVKPEEAAGLARMIDGLENIELRGLMTVPPIADDAVLSEMFGKMRELRDQCSEAVGRELRELSMGMSEDLEVAIREGATMVRVGRAIFGERE